MRTIGEAAEEQLAIAALLIFFAGDLLAPLAALSRSNERFSGISEYLRVKSSFLRSAADFGVVRSAIC
jgi:hypothetical protein